MTICAHRAFQAAKNMDLRASSIPSGKRMKKYVKNIRFCAKSAFLSPPRRPEDSRIEFERQNDRLRASSIPSGKKHGCARIEYSKRKKNEKIRQKYLILCKKCVLESSETSRGLKNRI